MSATINYRLPGIGFCALEIKPDFEIINPWFFLYQGFHACEHLTEVQHCDPESVEYAGTHRGWHVWLAHS